jgi:putative RecB family exonuclease
MDLAEFRKKPHLSASSVNDYIECGLHYKFSRIDRLEPEFRSDAMQFGSAMHRAIADFHQERMVGNVLTVSELQGIFEAHWRKIALNRRDIRFSKGKNFNVLLEDGKNLLQVYQENFSSEGFEVLAIEEPFSFTVEGLDVPVIGIFDLVEQDSSGTIIVSDLKTTSRTFSTGEVDRNFQITVYQMGVKANGYRDQEVLLRFDCLVKTKQPRFEQHYTARTGSDERRAVSKMQRVWDGISKGVFVPNDSKWKCHGCGFKTRCNRMLEE